MDQQGAGRQGAAAQPTVFIQQSPLPQQQPQFPPGHPQHYAQQQQQQQYMMQQQQQPGMPYGMPSSSMHSLPPGAHVQQPGGPPRLQPPGYGVPPQHYAQMTASPATSGPMLGSPMFGQPGSVGSVGGPASVPPTPLSRVDSTPIKGGSSGADDLPPPPSHQSMQSSSNIVLPALWPGSTGPTIKPEKMLGLALAEKLNSLASLPPLTLANVGRELMQELMARTTLLTHCCYKILRPYPASPKPESPENLLCLCEYLHRRILEVRCLLDIQRHEKNLPPLSEDDYLNMLSAEKEPAVELTESYLKKKAKYEEMLKKYKRDNAVLTDMRAQYTALQWEGSVRLPQSYIRK